MKTLSILQPWASLVAQGHKRIETRSWSTKYRGELLIHASARKIHLKEGMYDLFDHICRIGFHKDYINLPYGAIIGKVMLAEVVESRFCFSGNEFSGIWQHNCKWPVTEQELAFGDFSPGRFGWLLADPVLFERPIPCKGRLGLWNFDMLEYRRELVYTVPNVDQLLGQI